MTPEQQRIAIAEACGWTNVAPRIVKNVKHEGDDITVGIWSDDGWIPDYLNDLNAMHTAEKTLTQDQMIDYSQHVGKSVTSHLPASRAAWVDFGLIHATAAQRAEAFLRTIGKWEEAK
jgi:hypothetical protein